MQKRNPPRLLRVSLNYKKNKSHDRHIHLDQCKSIGLTVRAIEDDAELQDLVLTVHHCYMHALMNTKAFKIIENHNGAGFLKIEGESKTG